MKKENKFGITSSVQPKSGRLYAVIRYILPDEKAKWAWRALGLDEGTRKSEVTKAFREAVNIFETELEEKVIKRNRPDSDILVYDYLCQWLEHHKNPFNTAPFKAMKV